MQLTRENIIATLKQNKSFLEKEMGVKRIGLFGSYAHGLQKPDSDIDIFLKIDDNDYKKLLKILLFLENHFHKKVDLVYEGSHLRSSFLRTLESETIYA
jgi:predicted nucleotidyltransferase